MISSLKKILNETFTILSRFQNNLILMDKAIMVGFQHLGLNDLENLLKDIPVGIGLLDLSLCCVWVNPEMAKYVGKPIEQLLGKNLSRLFRPVSKEITQGFEKVLKTNHTVSIQICIKLPQKDQQLEYLLSYYPFSDEKGIMQFIGCLIQDITGKSVAHFQFLHESRFADNIFENFPEQFFIVNREGWFLRWNKQFEKFTGYSTPEISKLNISELYHVKSVDDFFKQFDRFFQTGSGYVEMEIKQKSGKHIPVILSGVIQEMDGRPCLIGLGLKMLDRQIEEKKVLLLSLNQIRETKNRLEIENQYLKKELELRFQHHEIIGQSQAIKKVLKKVEQVAMTDTSVLITGETGTGKELLARAIHHLSKRKNRPMVEVNCAALPLHLVENELFGHEKGAFTGAVSRQTGRFEVADGSTLFLDEISELPLELQAKLLRVLQEGKFERLGSWNTVSVNVRIVAATNKDLKHAVEQGTFRQDLYYRLSVFPISVPPLRHRKEDIPLLATKFVQEFSNAMTKEIKHIPDHVMQALQQYPWHGNVRELRNIIERAVILTEGPMLCCDLPGSDRAEFDEIMTLEDLERRYIQKILKKTEGRIRGIDGAAQILGLNPSTLESRMKKLGVNRKP